LYKTTTWYGGEVSIRLEPVGEGVALDVVAPGAPALENLGACQPHMTRQEPVADIEANRFLSMCIPAVPVTGPCFDQADEVESLVLNTSSLLWVRGPAVDEELEADIGEIEGFAFEPTGSLSLDVELEGDCLGGSRAHKLEVTWAFDQSETYKEGRRDGHEPWLGDV
jgi:hypothetical protein